MSEPIDSQPAYFSGLRAVPPAVQACFPSSDPARFPADLLPLFLLSRLFMELASNGASLCALAAATLQTAAVAIGSSMRLEIEDGRTIGPSFNLGYAVPPAIRNAGAIEPVIAPMRRQICAFQDRAREPTKATHARNISRKAADLEAARGTVLPNDGLIRSMSIEFVRLQAGPTPEMLLTRFSAADVERAVPRSVDQALIYLAECVDPSDAWQCLPRYERESLARMLNLSWDGSFHPGGRATVDLNLLWITPISSLPALYASRELLACGRPIPLLLLAESAAASRPASADTVADWDQKVSHLLDCRMLKTGRLYQLAGAAADEFSNFVTSLPQRLAGLPPEQQNHLAYLPDLARRILLILAIFSSAEALDHPTTSAAIELAEWFGMAHATALSEIPVVGPIVTRTDSTARPDKRPANEVMLAKITLKAPVTRRQLWDSCSKPARKGFQQVLEDLLATGKVRWLDKKHLVPGGWDPIGRVASAPTPTPTPDSLSSGASPC